MDIGSERVFTFDGIMAGITVEEGKVENGPAVSVEGDRGSFAEIELLQGDLQAVAIGFDQAFLSGPEMIKGLEGGGSGLDGCPLFWRELVFEIFKRQGFEELNVDAYPAMRVEHTDGAVAGVGDIKIGRAGEAGSLPYRILQTAEVGGLTRVGKGDAQEELAEEVGMSVLPSPVF